MQKAVDYMHKYFFDKEKVSQENKLVSLQEAVNTINDGDVLFLGSFVDNRRPMAAAYEIVRQGKKRLILLAECSLAEDILVGSGCAVAWRGCYTGMATFGLSPATLRKIEEEKFFRKRAAFITIASTGVYSPIFAYLSAILDPSLSSRPVSIRRNASEFFQAGSTQSF
jgi:hypothetical protein